MTRLKPGHYTYSPAYFNVALKHESWGALMLKDGLELILQNYLSARDKDFEGHPLGDFVRHKLPNEIEKIVGNTDRYKCTGSVGQGQWARCPWVAILDVFITETVQSGYYPVYLFREDMKGVYLSLNQGVTQVIEKYKTDAKEVLAIRATDFRAQLGKIPLKFSDTNIELATESPSELASFYEAGNICARYYSRGNIPGENELISDFKDMMSLYSALSYNENIQMNPAQTEPDEERGSKGVEDLRKLREHKRIERNRKWSKQAKKVHGYTCQACGFNFEEFYGPLGKDFIEAHHLKPIAELKGQVVEIDARRDFAVLCSNCHSMVHRFSKPEDIDGFRRVLPK